MIYLHIGSDKLLRKSDVTGIFDLDKCSTSVRTRDFLRKKEKAGKVHTVSSELPVSFIVHKSGEVYLSPISAAALNGRMEEKGVFSEETKSIKEDGRWSKTTQVR